MTTMGLLRTFNKFLPETPRVFSCQIAALTDSINHSLFLRELEQHWSYIFSWSWKSFTETDTDVSAAQAGATGSWENSSEYAQFLFEFDSAYAEPQRNFPFLLRSRGVCWPNKRAGTFKFQKTPLKETSIKTCKALCFISTRSFLRLLHYNCANFAL